MRVLSSGQSNAIGEDTGGNSTFLPKVHVWNNVYDQGGNGSAFVAPTLGSNPFNTLAAYNNIGVQFCNLMAQYLSKDIYYVLDGHTGTTISSWPGGITSNIITVWNAAFGSGKPADVFIWHQGENDSAAGTTLAAYQSTFNGIISALTSAGVIDGNTKIMIGGLCEDTPSFAAYNTNVLSQLGYPFISSHGLANRGDNIHFTGQSLCDFAQRYFNQTRGNFMTYSPVYFNSGSGLLEYDNGSGPTAVPSSAVGFSVTNAISFTPAIAGTTTAGTGTYGVQSGYYWQHDKIIFYSINLAWTAHTGTGNMKITGMPFISFSGSGFGGTTMMLLNQNITTPASSQLTGQIGAGSAEAQLYSIVDATGALAAVAIDTSAQIVANGYFTIT